MKKLNWEKLQKGINASLAVTSDIVDEFYGDIAQMRKEIDDEEELKFRIKQKTEAFKIILSLMVQVDMQEASGELELE